MTFVPKVIAGVVVEVATDPVKPFADNKDTLVTPLKVGTAQVLAPVKKVEALAVPVAVKAVVITRVATLYVPEIFPCRATFDST